MSLLSRIANLVRRDRVNREIDDEFESHIEEAIERGRDPAEARQSFGSVLRQREASLDVRVVMWLDSLRADVVFGWRRLWKNKISSAGAILSLGIAIGGCTSAFRLIDALLLRPLPVAHPERLYLFARQGLGPSGDFRISDSCEYPLFRRMRAASRDQAELIAMSFPDRVDVSYSAGDEMEKAYRQYVSGWMFGTFGLQPAAGRLLVEGDDLTPGAHPYVVLSHDYWLRRFGQDPRVVGRRVRIGADSFEIIGVGPAGFTGAEPGTFVDIFVPTMMNTLVNRSDASWFRAFVVVRPDTAIEPLRAKLHAITRQFHEERANGWTSQTKLFIDRFLNQTVLLEPAATGASGMQADYRRSLIALGVLMTLVLLIACANVANLMTAQAAARAREMALRVSIGAGRGRLIQMVLVQSAWLGLLAAALGGLFAWWAAPVVVGSINPPDNPARLALPADWRVFGFALALTFLVTLVFGLAPALRASHIKPASALKGGDDPHSRRRLMHSLVAIQIAFCFVVYLAAGLFVTTFNRLAHQSTGFSPEGILILETTARRPQPPALWDQLLEHLRAVPGVQSAALAGWPLLGGNGWNGFIWVDGAPTEVLAYFLAVSPGWTKTMGIPSLDGRDFRANEAFPGGAIVNEAFVKQCFRGENPLGRSFEKESGDGVTRWRFPVVGVVRDARYRNMREPITPTAYVPFRSVDAKGVPQPKASGAFIVRTSNPSAMASILRQEVRRTRPEFYVSNVRTQTELIERHTIRERLLAALAVFFAGVALLLGGVGLYGVLDYSMLQRRREIGIRLAIGARPSDIGRLVTMEVFYMVVVGAIAGLALGMTLERYIRLLLYGVKASDPRMLTLPALTILAAVLLAAIPAMTRALRIDPVTMLRSD